MPSRRYSILAAAVLAPAAVAAPLPRFTQPNAIWNVDVSTATLRGNSAAMMLHLESIATGLRGGTPCYDYTGVNYGCWGDGANHGLQIDLSFYVLHADNATPTKPVAEASAYYTPDCDAGGVQFQFPSPVGGGIEGTVPPSYACDTNNNDCHLLVSNDATKILYEAYNATADGSAVQAVCALTWDLTRVYPRYGRGEHCTSADGAGFPIAPLLFNADDVYAAAQVQGDLGHAIRWIIGNNRMMNDRYVHPASHGTLSTSDPDLVNGVPYGSHLRLKSTFDVNGFSANENIRVLLRTLQKYGMFLSDGGGIPLTGEADAFNTHKWAELGMDSHSLFNIRPTDFDVIEAGEPMTVTYDCVRTPQDFVFIDGYDF